MLACFLPSMHVDISCCWVCGFDLNQVTHSWKPANCNGSFLFVNYVNTVYVINSTDKVLQGWLRAVILADIAVHWAPLGNATGMYNVPSWALIIHPHAQKGNFYLFIYFQSYLKITWMTYGSVARAKLFPFSEAAFGGGVMTGCWEGCDKSRGATEVTELNGTVISGTVISLCCQM